MIGGYLFAQAKPVEPGNAAEVVVTEGLRATGWIGWNTSVVLTVVLIVLAVLWLIRQRELLGNPTTALFAVLRSVVIVVAVWMVAQPSWKRTETVSRRAEVVVLADRSGSMDTIDPPDAQMLDDWHVAISNPNDAVAIVQRVQLDLEMAGRSDQIDANLIDRAVVQLKGIRDADAGLVDECLSSLSAASEASSQWADTDDRAEKLALVASREDSLQSALIDVETLRSLLVSQRVRDGRSERRTRKELVADLLTRFESQLAELPARTVSLRRAVFSDRVQALTSNSWSDELVGGDASVDSSGSASSSSSRTDVSAALSFVRSIDPKAHLAAVLMLTEGQHNAASRQTPVEVAAGLSGTPVFTVSIGDQSRRRDIAIHRVDSPAIVYEEDRPQIEALISSYECEGDQVNVTLSDGQQTIETKSIRFPSKISDVAVQFNLPPSPIGRKQYRLSVEALEGETSLQNNHAVLSVQTIRSKLFLLIADRQPRWEYRYLEQLFRRDNRVELDKLLLMPKVKSTLFQNDADATSLLPTTIDGWSKFDVAVLGDLPPEVMTPAVCKAMASWVKAGGNVIIVAGKHFMPAAYTQQPWFDLLPVTNQAIESSPSLRPVPSLEGFTHPAIRLDDSQERNRALWKRWMSGPVPGFVSPYQVAKPTSTVLSSLGSLDAIEDEDVAPAFDQLRPSWLSVHRVGSGQVAYLSSPISYRLRIRSGDTYHHRFWGQLVRWMTTAELSSGDGMVEIKSDRSTYDEGQRAGIRVRLSDASGIPVRGGDVQIELTSDSGNDTNAFPPQTMQLVESKQSAGVYQITLDRLPAGVYETVAIGPTIQSMRKTTASQGQPESKSSDRSAMTFTVQSSGDLEHLMTEADPLLLSQISEATGGMRISPAALEEVLHVVSLAPDVSENTRMTTLWDRWTNLWLVLGCLTTEWWIRRRKGLV